MELSFSELRTKEVVNTQDGRKLGKVCDIALCYPENRWLGIVVPNGRGWGSKKNSLFIDLRRIVKIGEDVVLVNVGAPRGGGGKKPHPPYPTPQPQSQGGFDGGYAAGRNFEEYE